jgi:hypothetical protein
MSSRFIPTKQKQTVVRLASPYWGGHSRAPQFVTGMAPEHIVTITVISLGRVRTGKQNKDA